MFVIFTNANETILSKEEALKIGEEKYLKFLWMVDGVFNNTKDDNDFTVNGKELSKEDKIFKCNYKNSRECIGENFEIEFSNLFSKNINYDKVYSDGIMNSLYTYKNNEYIFSNSSSCNENRMSLEHQLKVVNISNNKLTYKVEFINRQSKTIEKRDFSLIKEDNEWKISTAFYYDICEYKYYIY